MKARARKRLIVRELPFHENLYGRDVTLLYGTRDEINRRLRRILPGDPAHNDLSVASRGKWILWENREGYLRDLICIVRSSPARELSALAHEVLHHTGNTLRHAGIEHTEATEEAYCYYLQWIINRCLVAMGRT
jgi:hypothetical protein